MKLINNKNIIYPRVSDNPLSTDKVENVLRPNTKCSECNETKAITEFYFRKTYNSYNKRCKECVKSKQRVYYKENKESISKNKKKYYEDNADLIKKRRKTHNVNKELRAATQRRWYNEVFKKNIYNVLKQNLRCSTRRYIHKNNLSVRASEIDLFGCTPEQLKSHLESQFTEGMSWENYGEWHIDHIKPLSLFNEHDIHLAANYTNLQPLWAADNIRKGNKY